MITATLGFLFSADWSHVLLIHKNRPAWQQGKINGLGGKCEGGETPSECISREVAEESGLFIPPPQWQEVGHLTWTEWYVTVLAARHLGSIKDPLTQTDEQVAWYPVGKLPNTVMTNLKWLIPLAIDALTNDSQLTVKAKYRDT